MRIVCQKIGTDEYIVAPGGALRFYTMNRDVLIASNTTLITGTGVSNIWTGDASEDFFFLANRAGAQACHRSADGINWQTFPVPGFSEGDVSVNYNRYNGNLMVGAFVSTDNGETFTPATGFGSGIGRRMYKCAATPTTWFCGSGTASGVTRISFDGGFNWVGPAIPSGRSQMAPLYIERDDLMIAFVSSVGTAAGELWISEDRGNTWIQGPSTPLQEFANMAPLGGTNPGALDVAFNPFDGYCYMTHGRCFAMRSPDGINWDLLKCIGNNSYNSQAPTAASSEQSRTAIWQDGTVLLSGVISAGKAGAQASLFRSIL